MTEYKHIIEIYTKEPIGEIMSKGYGKILDGIANDNLAFARMTINEKVETPYR